MAARAGRGGTAAGWAISLGLHLLFLALVLLAPIPRIASPPTIELRLTPPPDSYFPLQSAPKASEAQAVRTPTARAAPSPIQRAADPAQQISVPAPPSTAPPTVSVTPSPAQPAPASAPTPSARAAGAAASTTPAGNGTNAAAVNALRQTFGCSSGMRQTLTVKEQAGCEQRAAARAKDVPDRSGDTIPKYKRDYYDAVVAAQNSPNHIPGTACVSNAAVVSSARGGVGIVVDVLHPVTCVPLPGAGPKPPEPTLKDLGLAQ